MSTQMPETEQAATEPDTAPATPSGVTPPEYTPPEAPTAASAWKSPRNEGFMVQLPSGNAAKLRRTLDLVTLMKAGEIPNPLMSVVGEMINGKKKEIKMDEVEPEQMVALLQLVDDCIPGIFIEPMVMLPPSELTTGEKKAWNPPADSGGISIHDLDQNDRMFAFAFAQGAPADLERFRAGQAEALADLPDVPTLPNITVPADGPGE